MWHGVCVACVGLGRLFSGLRQRSTRLLNMVGVGCCMFCGAVVPAQDAAGGDSVSSAVGTYAHVFSAAVLALLPQGTKQQHTQQDVPQQNGHADAQAAALTGTGLPELLLMSHHPAITAGVAKPLRVWHTACHRMRAIPAALKGGSGEHQVCDMGAMCLAGGCIVAY